MKSFVNIVLVSLLLAFSSSSFADEKNVSNTTEAEQSSAQDQKQDTKEQKAPTRFKKSEHVFFD